MEMDEKKLMNEEGEVDQSTQNYRDAIKDLKAKTVDKAKYDALLADQKALLEQIVNGQQVEKEADKVVHTQEEIQKLREKLYKDPDKGLTNLEYVKTTLELREAVMENGGQDPFLPVGANHTPTVDEIEIANRVANGLQQAVEYANGDSAVFTNEVMRKLN